MTKLFQCVSKNNRCYSSVVNWDSNNNFTTIFDQFKNVNGISNDINAFSKAINNFKIAGVKDEMQVRSLMNQYQHLGDGVLNAGGSFLEGTATVDEFTEACNNAIPTTAKFTNALKNIGGNMAISAAISLVISAVSGLIKASDEIAQKTQEVGDSFVSTKGEISDYKTQVESLYETINNSSSSYAEVTDARKQLLSIQSEMIEQYGTEQASIEAITDAINGEADAWEKLVAEKWKDTKNEINDNSGLSGIWKKISNWANGYDTNIDRMEDEYGNYETKLDVTQRGYGTEEAFEQAKELLREFGEFELNDSGIESSFLSLSGNATEVYEKLLSIQGLLEDYDIDLGKDFNNSLTEKINDAKEVSNQYKDVYDQFVLNEKILKDTDVDGYADTFKKITEEYDKYTDAVASNDKTEIEYAKESFIKTVSGAMDKATESGDIDVADYFESMYPDLQDEVSSWRFDVAFNANTDGLKDDITDALDVLEDFSKEELLNFNIATATDEQVEAYQKLKSAAKEYLSFEDMINKFEDQGLVISESYQNLVNKFGEDAVKKLSTEELQIAYTISTEEADEAIEKEKSKVDAVQKELNKTGLTGLIADYDHAVESSAEYVDSLDDIYKAYNGIDNIDRDIIYWNDETLSKNKTFIEEQFGSYEEGVKQLKGTWSTVLGTSQNIDGVEIAYTQMLQTDNGLVPLTEDTFWNYFNGIFNESFNEDGTFNAEKFIQLDASGTDMLVNGQMQHVANMIAAAEGQYMNGVKLTAEDVIAIGSPGYDEDGNDLLPDNNSIFKGYSMHDVQGGALETEYRFAQLDEKCKELSITMQEAFNKSNIEEYTNYTSIALQRLVKQKKALDYTVSYDPSTAFDSLTTALEEEAEQGYLTDSTLQSLKSTYGDLSEVLINTANGVQLNSAAMMELTEQNGQAALVNTQLKEAEAVKKREDAVEKLNKRLKEYASKSKLTTAQQNKLKKAQKEGTSAMLKAVDANKKLSASQKEVLTATINEIEELNNEINKYDSLEQSILASISAINLYKKAKETANASDNYNYVQSEIETNKTAFDNGLTKTDEFQQWMKYIGGFNQSLEYSDAEIQKYMNRVERYYTENGSGLFNWLDDASTMSEGMIQKLADGSYSINITDINTLAQRMDQSVSSVTDILLRMSETSGFDIDFSNLSDSLVSGLESLPDNVYDARTQLDEYKSIIEQLKAAGYDTTELEEQYSAVYANLHPELDVALNISTMSETDLLARALGVVDDVQKKLGETEVKINLDSEDIDDIDKQVKEISGYRDTIDIGVDATGYENATILMKVLLDKKHQLEIDQTPVLSVDTSELEENVQKVVATIQAYVEAKQQLENAKAGTVDISVEDAEAQLASVTSTLQDMTADLYVLGVTADVEANPEKFMEQVSAINVNSIMAKDQTDINVGADTTQADKDVADAKARISKEKVDVQVGANTTGMATTITEYLNSQSFSVNVTANVTTTGASTGSSGKGNVKKSGVQQLTGSAHAQGTWNVGNRAGEGTLVGEIAPEIWVHDGIWETVGDNGAEFITTHENDIIFNHKQSEQILKYGQLNSRGRFVGGSFVSGSAFNGLTVSGSAVSRNDYSKYHSVSSSTSSNTNTSNTNTASEEAEEFKEDLDWIERKLKEVERQIENLDQTVSATYKSWSERNTALSSEISKVNEEISIQQQAYERYMQQANSVGLSDAYKQLIQAGKIDIETITDEDLKEQIDDYQNW